MTQGNSIGYMMGPVSSNNVLRKSKNHIKEKVIFLADVLLS